jgi:LysM repeat protein
MRRIIVALLFCFSSSWAVAQAPAAPLELAPNAPDRHIVVPGDTLWGIASTFLKDPYRWQEIWRLNPDQVKNPHLIYPGQVVILDKSGDRPLLKIGRLIKAEPKVYVETDRKEIPAIPQQVIEPFLSHPLVIDENGMADAARIVAIQESRVYVGAGNTVYAKNAQGDARVWNIFRPGKPLIDPDFPKTEDTPAKLLGFEAKFLGTAKKLREGEPATFEILSSVEEIGRDDRLVPAPRAEIMSYIPHAPSKPIRGRIIGLYGGVGEGGNQSIVSISRGKNDGLEAGHVLALLRKGATVAYRFEDKPEITQLPDERYGLLFVFRVFDSVSYGLVMNISRSVSEGDVVETP